MTTNDPMPPKDDEDLFADAVRRLDRAFEHAPIDEEALEKLRSGPVDPHKMKAKKGKKK